MHVPLDYAFVANTEMLQAQNRIFTNSKNHYANGYLSVQLDRAFYYPGETVNGRVYIMSNFQTRCQMIKLEVEGKEKAEYTRFWTEYETRTRWVDRDGERVEEEYQEAVERSEHLKKKIVAMNFEVPLMDMAPLDYTI